MTFITDATGQVLERDEADGNQSTGDPRELHYYFMGLQVGDVSNNGTSDVNYAASIAEHTKIPSNGPFRDGSASASLYGDFDENYDPINGLNYESAAASITVQEGDTLESLAQQIWGDASFWYMIADANGIQSDGDLVAGMTHDSRSRSRFRAEFRAVRRGSPFEGNPTGTRSRHPKTCSETDRRRSIRGKVVR